MAAPELSAATRQAAATLTPVTTDDDDEVEAEIDEGMMTSPTASPSMTIIPVMEVPVIMAALMVGSRVTEVKAMEAKVAMEADTNNTDGCYDR